VPVEPRFDLLVVGDLNPDVVVAGLPPRVRFGQREQLVPHGTLTVGGSAGIVACGAARLGLRTALVAVVGDDAAGRLLLAQLAELHVETSGCLVTDAAPTGLTVCLVRGDDRAIVTAPGCVARLDTATVDRDLLRAARHVHVASPFLQPLLAAGLRGLLDEARAAGLGTSLDCNDDPTGVWDAGVQAALPAVDVLFANRRETLALAGRRSALGSALERLAARGPLPVVKLGGHGAVTFRDGVATALPALPVETVDAVGAGDGFAAGFLYGRLSGADPARCLALGVACGSLSTRRRGGVDAQATSDEAEHGADAVLAAARRA
jgi:sugar/nucleoside kinase (ribokinase family)